MWISVLKRQSLIKHDTNWLKNRPILILFFQNKERKKEKKGPLKAYKVTFPNSVSIWVKYCKKSPACPQLKKIIHPNSEIIITQFKTWGPACIFNVQWMYPLIEFVINCLFQRSKALTMTKEGPLEHFHLHGWCQQLPGYHQKAEDILSSRDLCINSQFLSSFCLSLAFCVDKYIAG